MKNRMHLMVLIVHLEVQTAQQAVLIQQMIKRTAQILLISQKQLGQKNRIRTGKGLNVHNALI